MDRDGFRDKVWGPHKPSYLDTFKVGKPADSTASTTLHTTDYRHPGGPTGPRASYQKILQHSVTPINNHMPPSHLKFKLFIIHLPIPVILEVQEFSHNAKYSWRPSISHVEQNSAVLGPVHTWASCHAYDKRSTGRIICMSIDPVHYSVLLVLCHPWRKKVQELLWGTFLVHIDWKMLENTNVQPNFWNMTLPCFV